MPPTRHRSPVPSSHCLWVLSFFGSSPGAGRGYSAACSIDWAQIRAEDAGQHGYRAQAVGDIRGAFGACQHILHTVDYVSGAQPRMR